MINIENLTKKYQDKKVLNNISFNVKKGEILGFLGPNGAGKTTTLRIITGFIAPTKGKVKVAKIDLSKDSLSVRKKIGYLAENNPLYDDMKVYEFLYFIASLKGVKKEKIVRKIREINKTCGLEKVISRPINELSKGYKQRVGLAQAMINNPEILILDEPTSGLDPNQIVEIRELIKKIGEEKTVIFSTHILSEVQAVCDRIIIIHNGKIVASGTSEELLKSTGSKKTIYVKIKGNRDEVLGQLKRIEGADDVNIKDKESDNVYGYEIKSEKNIDLREKLSTKVMKNNWSILEFRKEEKGLEDVFRKLTK
ncbi:MAG: ATP-binding cassette domain-containing protein [Xanthomonadaceae bacterium]|nr:ATP-binding cassette domain-containing protein [Rhodospirillaceae bacterium]NIA17768.1 ATP-binding cassette domain-containing protein [Xanthomonadaceae bacterium]